VGGIKSEFLWRLGSPAVSKSITRKVFSSVWVALNWRPNIVGENCLKEGKGHVCRRRVLGDST